MSIGQQVFLYLEQCLNFKGILWGFCLNPEEALWGNLSLLIPNTMSPTLILPDTALPSSPER